MQADFDLMALFAVPAQILVALWWSERLSPPVQLRLVLTVASVAFV
jgi:hypothetical protein